MQKQMLSKKFTFLEFSEDQSFDKVQSSMGNNSNKIVEWMKSSQPSQCNTNTIPRAILKIKPVYKNSVGKPIYPMSGRPLWNSDCHNCDQKLQKIGLRLGMSQLMKDEVKNIYVLSKGAQMEYAVEYCDSRILKFDSKILALRHPQQMIKFLESQAF